MSPIRSLCNGTSTPLDRAQVLPQPNSMANSSVSTGTRRAKDSSSV
ncbi:hypothetical protein [Archangium sp.]